MADSNPVVSVSIEFDDEGSDSSMADSNDQLNAKYSNWFEFRFLYGR